MKLYENDYKGKWHVYGDEEDDTFGSNGTVNSDTITDVDLLSHAHACGHYGIPMYTGADEKFRERCDTAWELSQQQASLLDTPPDATQRL